MKKIIAITGARGRLATEIIKQGKDKFGFVCLDIDNVDITNKSKLFDYFENIYKLNDIDIVLHCAAWTAVDKAEHNKETCWNTNVNGTKNVVDTCRRFGLPIIYISTDYVFDGGKGNYSEEDTPDPVNYYALTKLLGEYVVRQYNYKHIVVRTSFKPEKWQYISAYDDAYTSAMYTPEIANEILFLLDNYDELYRSYLCFRNQENIFHIGNPVKRSVYELAKIKNPNVVGMSRLTVNYKVPRDVSLNISKWLNFKKNIVGTKFNLAN